jgi:hypothetical protein
MSSTHPPAIALLPRTLHSIAFGIISMHPRSQWELLTLSHAHTPFDSHDRIYIAVHILDMLFIAARSPARAPLATATDERV